MIDVRQHPRDEVVDADYLVSLGQETLTQVRPDEPRPAGNQCTHDENPSLSASLIVPSGRNRRVVTAKRLAPLPWQDEAQLKNCVISVFYAGAGPVPKNDSARIDDPLSLTGSRRAQHVSAQPTRRSAPTLFERGSTPCRPVLSARSQSCRICPNDSRRYRSWPTTSGGAGTPRRWRCSAASTPKASRLSITTRSSCSARSIRPALMSCSTTTGSWPISIGSRCSSTFI